MKINFNKRRFNDAMENQFVKRWRKEDISLVKKYEYATEDYIVETYLHEQYRSPRCWLTVEVAVEL